MQPVTAYNLSFGRALRLDRENIAYTAKAYSQPLKSRIIGTPPGVVKQKIRYFYSYSVGLDGSGSMPNSPEDAIKLRGDARRRQFITRYYPAGKLSGSRGGIAGGPLDPDWF